MSKIKEPDFSALNKMIGGTIKQDTGLTVKIELIRDEDSIDSQLFTTRQVFYAWQDREITTDIAMAKIEKIIKTINQRGE